MMSVKHGGIRSYFLFFFKLRRDLMTQIHDLPDPGKTLYSQTTEISNRIDQPNESTEDYLRLGNTALMALCQQNISSKQMIPQILLENILLLFMKHVLLIPKDHTASIACFQSKHIVWVSATFTLKRVT